ncbi:hypothetical protein [Polaromonas sp. LjRoot131]|uniref:hypothetical protein n=1 Tax=Polaromonas sp. LjRoot131 TaxID=3342262 RepID=UPI003ECC201F
MPPSFTSSSDTAGNPGDGGAWLRFALEIIGYTAAGLVLVLGLMYGLMKAAGEYLDSAEVLQHQQKNGGLYRSALKDDMMEPAFRFVRYDALQPEIVALGSSRVLQFRQSHFTRPFVNMGMSVDYAVLPNIASALTTTPNRLKLVILGIDHWQVNEAVMKQRADPSWSPRAPNFTGIRRLKQELFDFREQHVNGPLRMLAQHRFGLKELWAVLCQCDAGGHTSNLGLAALVDGSGIDTQGSYHYTWVYDRPASLDGFKTFLDRLKARENGFQVLDNASEARIGYIIEAVKLLESAGVKVVLFVPPVPPQVASAMDQAGGYGVFSALDKSLHGTGSGYYNFHNPAATIRSPDCEFADGLHGGEVTYLRMLGFMSDDRPEIWQPYIDPAHVKRLVKEGAGRVNVDAVPLSGNRERREVDFLGLGCNKTQNLKSGQ